MRQIQRLCYQNLQQFVELNYQVITSLSASREYVKQYSQFKIDYFEGRAPLSWWAEYIGKQSFLQLLLVNHQFIKCLGDSLTVSICDDDLLTQRHHMAIGPIDH